MHELLHEVEETRKQMIIHGIEYGLHDIKTIELSKKLDELLNIYSNKVEQIQY